MHDSDSETHDNDDDVVRGEDGHLSEADLQNKLQSASIRSLDLFTSLADVRLMKLTRNEVSIIAAALMVNSSLRKLRLTCCQIGEKGARAIARGLAVNTTLRLLDLCRNDLGEGGGREIAEALVRNTTLRRLELGANDLSKGGTRAICKMLMINSSLRSLDLLNNNIKENCAEAIRSALVVNASLTEIDLSQSDFGPDGRSTAEALLTNSTLQELILCESKLSGRGTREIASAMMENTTLRSLDLSGNFLEHGAHTIAKMLKVNSSLHDIGLMQLPPYGLGLGDKGATAIADSLAHNTSLRSLSLTLPDLQDASGRALADALRTNRGLRALKCICPWGNAFARHETAFLGIADALKSVPRFHKLTIYSSDNYIFKKVVDAMGLPAEAKSWTNDEFCQHFWRHHREKVLVFCMGLHPRLGAVSSMSALSEDAVTMLCETYFGLPHGYLSMGDWKADAWHVPWWISQ